MKLLDAFRRRPDDPATPTDERLSAVEQRRRHLPDPGSVPAARGSWEEAALINVEITEVVKRELGTITPPWKK